MHITSGLAWPIQSFFALLQVLPAETAAIKKSKRIFMPMGLK
jgi:hypothetical protein